MLSVLYPDVMRKRISELTPELLAQLGVRALVLDLDNTLTTHNNPVPDQDVLLWLEAMRKQKIPMLLVSNNSAQRVAPFAAELRLPYTADAFKPLPIGFMRAAKRLNLAPENIAIVGDQIFTDVLGGNLFGAKTVLVEPMQPETGPFFRFKRKLEFYILRAARKSGKVL